MFDLGQIDIEKVIMLMAAFVVAITVHEFMHAWTANYFGDDTARMLGRISLNPAVHFDPLGFIMFLFIAIGGFGFAWGKPVPVNDYRLRPLGKFGRRGTMAIIAFAGPLSNVALAFVGAWSVKLGSFGTMPTWWLQFLSIFISVNVGLAAFNMIPIPPLDGSKILAALVPEYWTPLLGQFQRVSFGIVLILIFFAPGVLGAMVYPVSDLIMRLLPIG